MITKEQLDKWRVLTTEDEDGGVGSYYILVLERIVRDLITEVEQSRADIKRAIKKAPPTIWSEEDDDDLCTFCGKVTWTSYGKHAINCLIEKYGVK